MISENPGFIEVSGLDLNMIHAQLDLLTKTGQDHKSLNRMIKDLEECESYDLVLKDKADQQIEFDLDDGVTGSLASNNCDILDLSEHK